MSNFNIDQLKRIISGALFAAGEPLSLENLQKMFDAENAPTNKELKEILSLLQQDYQNTALELNEVANGYRFRVRQDLSPWISKLWEEKPPRYSRALMETFALIVYRQPITRPEIEDVRGVAVSPEILKKLLDRNWIKIVGHREVPGKPALYATTKQFLDDFNLKTLEELPTLEQITELDLLENKLTEQLSLEVSEELPM